MERTIAHSHTVSAIGYGHRDHIAVILGIDTCNLYIVQSILRLQFIGILPIAEGVVVHITADAIIEAHCNFGFKHQRHTIEFDSLHRTFHSNAVNAFRHRGHGYLVLIASIGKAFGFVAEIVLCSCTVAEHLQNQFLGSTVVLSCQNGFCILANRVFTAMHYGFVCDQFYADHVGHLGGSHIYCKDIDSVLDNCISSINSSSVACHSNVGNRICLIRFCNIEVEVDIKIISQCQAPSFKRTFRFAISENGFR